MKQLYIMLIMAKSSINNIDPIWTALRRHCMLIRHYSSRSRDGYYWFQICSTLIHRLHVLYYTFYISFSCCRNVLYKWTISNQSINVIGRKVCWFHRWETKKTCQPVFFILYRARIACIENSKDPLFLYYWNHCLFFRSLEDVILDY